MVEEQSILIGELAAQCGVSVRTIRYYIEEKLLPPPRVQGKYTVYDEEYTDRIQLIRHLKNAYLPLREIRRVLESQNGQEIKMMLESYERGETPLLPTSTDQTPAGGQSAMEYISGVMKYRQPQGQREFPPVTPHPQPNLSVSGPSLGVKKQEERHLIESPAAAGTNWQRIVLAPGVELHVEEGGDRHLQKKIAHILAMARKLFAEDLP